MPDLISQAQAFGETHPVSSSSTTSSSSYASPETGLVPTPPSVPLLDANEGSGVALTDANVLFGSMPYTNSSFTANPTPSTAVNANLTNFSDPAFNPTLMDPCSSFDPSSVFNAPSLDMTSFMDIDGSLGGQTAIAWQEFVNESGMGTKEGMQDLNGFNTWEDMGFVWQ